MFLKSHDACFYVYQESSPACVAVRVQADVFHNARGICNQLHLYYYFFLFSLACCANE